jgi:predicted nucleic acid-binding protein
MRIYLDNCVFNRPFDDQSHLRVRLETEAKLYIQAKIKQGDLQLVWSYILEFENAQNPFHARKQTIAQWKNLASVLIPESSGLLAIARELLAKGIKPKDALHIASAIKGEADCFLSTDDKLLKKLVNISKIRAMNPVNFIGAVDEYDYRH